MMSEILLTIGIPTYNRPKRLFNILQQMTKISSNEIEIVIFDDASNENYKEIIDQFNDNRICYYHNKRNLGFDANLLKVIERAHGKYIFTLSDEDELNIKSIDWLLNFIKQRDEFSQILGCVGDSRSVNQPLYYSYEDRIYKKGLDSLKSLLYNHSYLSGIVIKRNAINLSKASKYIGCFYIHQILQSYAMMQGPTMTTSKIFVSIGKQLESHILGVVKKKHILSYNHFFNRIITIKYFIKNIFDLFEDKPKIQNYLIKRKTSIFANFIGGSVTSNTKIIISWINLLKIIPQILTIKELRKSIKFWVEILIRLIKNYYVELIRKNRVSNIQNRGLILRFKRFLQIVKF